MDSMVKFLDKPSGLWYVGIYSNNFRDKVDHIISLAAHEKFETFLQKTGISIPIIVFHLPQYRDEVHFANILSLVSGEISAEKYTANLKALYGKNTIAMSEAVFVENGFAFVVGKVLPEREQYVRDKLIPMQKDLGMSHGFIVSDKSDSIINEYFSFEFSVVPNSLAANGITLARFKDLDMSLENFVKKLTDDQKDQLRQLIDPEAVEAQTDEARRVLEEAFDSKALESAEEDAPETEVADDAYTEFRTRIFKDLDVENLSKALQALGEMAQSFGERIDGLETRVNHTEKDMDTRVAEAFEPTNWLNTIQSRSVEEEEPTEGDLLEALKGNIPDLAEDLATDQKADLDDPSVGLLWGPLGVNVNGR
jgi:hypothetical protein